MCRGRYGIQSAFGGGIFYEKSVLKLRSVDIDAGLCDRIPLDGECVPATTAMTDEVRKEIVSSFRCSLADMSVVPLQIILCGRDRPSAGSKKRCWARTVQAPTG